jgi:hypothetical protein
MRYLAWVTNFFVLQKLGTIMPPKTWLTNQGVFKYDAMNMLLKANRYSTYAGHTVHMITKPCVTERDMLYNSEVPPVSIHTK